jgi:hypothetical protein
MPVLVSQPQHPPLKLQHLGSSSFMTIKRIMAGLLLFSLVTIALFFNHQDSAFALRYRETDWTDTDASMTELINNGWKIINHDASALSTSDSRGNWGWKIETYTFMLNKENKYILCYLQNPKPPRAETAGCRGLN